MKKSSKSTGKFLCIWGTLTVLNLLTKINEISLSVIGIAKIIGAATPLIIGLIMLNKNNEDNRSLSIKNEIPVKQWLRKFS